MAKTTEQFIKKAKSIHGDKFNYSKTIYIGWNKEIIVICKLHGEFKCLPNNHLRGKFGGCQLCNTKKKITTEQFIKKAKNIFSDYDYSKTTYVNSYTQIKVICKLHGEFNSYPSIFLKGEGCPVCIPRRETIINKEKEKNKFIIKANKIHNNKYNYDLVNYINNKTKVKIICPKHGAFFQTPDKHLHGNGCSKCIGRNRTTEETIKDIENMYPSMYDLSKFKYINSTTNGKICCKKHNYWFEDNYHKLMTSTNRRCCAKEWQSNPNLYIKEMLDKYKIKNFTEYSFDDCKNINKLLFDFYLPDYNIVIEYQGEWHYNDYINNLKIQQKRDQIKRDYCKEKGIKEIEIPYWDFDKIESIIKLIL